MRCKACDCSIDVRDRVVSDEDGALYVMLEDLCSPCIMSSYMKYSEDELKDIYSRTFYETIKVIC
jgi:hypothetical protein